MTTQAEARTAYISSILSNWPPMTSEQQRIIEANLGPRASAPSPSVAELAERKKHNEDRAAARVAKKASLAMTACDVCNLQPEAHRIRQANSVDMHEWQPGRAEKLMARR